MLQRFLLLALVTAFLFLIFFKPPNNEITSSPSPSPHPLTTPIPSQFLAPIDEFKSRITKKSFGDYITPKSSPVSPEKFTGFHTGVDVEYTDIEADIEVRSTAAGEIIISRTASGYGGVIVIRHQINQEILYSIYGHLRPDSLLPVGTSVSAGQKIALLGTGFTSETDGERKHLHFALSKSNNLRGYVATKAELINWLNPFSKISD